MVILDTDLVTLLEKQNSSAGARARERLRALQPDEITTSIITYEEQMRGWLSYLARAKNLAGQVDAYRRLSRHIEYYSRIRVHPFTELAAVEYQTLRNQRLRIGTMDLKIAAIALSLRGILLSRNLKDFRQIPNLDVQDWSA
jgi:tRNA(fMet)-specific endonuclease VapC